jgi:hypothetical protein
MSSRMLVRWGGPAAMLGGSLWIVGAVATALKPEGCIGAECDLPGRSMRAGTVLDAAVFLVAMLLIALGGAAVVIRARRAGQFGGLGRIGLVGSVVGLIVLLAASLVQAIVFGGDLPSMPLFVIAGGLVLVIGLLLLGIASLRAGVLSRWAGALLIIGALAMLGFNDQDARALMAIPFGIAWVGVGYALWSGQGEQPA